MKKQLNLHDSQILKIITNPISKTMQIILSHTLGKIMEIRIRCIKKIEQDKKSMAFRITLQDENNTLTDDIINKEIINIKAGLEKNIIGLSLR